MQVLKMTTSLRVGLDQLWEYVGESERAHKIYLITEILPAVKRPQFSWHQGIRYRPVTLEDGAPNDYVRLEGDFLSCFRRRTDLEPRGE